MEKKNIDRKKLALALKEQGKSYKEIGEIFGISRQRAEQLCRQTEPARQTKWSRYREEWKELYETMTLEEIAEKYKAPVSSVRKQIKSAGVELRKRGAVKQEVCDMDSFAFCHCGDPGGLV